MGKRRGRAKSRNMYKGPMNMDNGVGLDCGREVVQGRGGQWGELLGQL